MIQRVIENILENINQNKKHVLILELILTLFCIGVMSYSALGNSVLEFLAYPVSAILFVPFFSTLTYYKGFKKTSIASLLAVGLVLLIGVLVILATPPSQASGLFAVFIILYSVVGAAIAPYLIFTSSLIVHYVRER